MYEVSSETLNLYSSRRDSQTFASRKTDFRYVTGHSVLRHRQIFVTVKNCRLVSPANHIQYKLYASYARDFTMAAAGHAYGMARAAPGIKLQFAIRLRFEIIETKVFISRPKRRPQEYRTPVLSRLQSLVVRLQ